MFFFLKNVCSELHARAAKNPIPKQKSSLSASGRLTEKSFCEIDLGGD